MKRTIGEAARASGVSAKRIRHYERIGLLARPGRTASGYRTFAERDVHELRFIDRARSLGFSLDEIAELLDLWRDRRRTSSAVKALATRHLEALEHRIRELTAMRDTIAHLASSCHGDSRPECPILTDLAGGNGQGPGRP